MLNTEERELFQVCCTVHIPIQKFELVGCERLCFLEIIALTLEGCLKIGLESDLKGIFFTFPKFYLTF